MCNNFYNSYHKQNNKVQLRPISKRNFTYRNLIHVIDDYAKKGMDVLDVGCGVGTIDFYLSPKVHSITGMDISSKALGLARKSAKELRLQNIIFINNDLNDLKSCSNKYDLVICSEVIEHIIDDKKLLKWIYLSMKNGGVFIISTPSANAPLYRLGLLNDFDRKVGHIRRYNGKVLETLLVNSGFEIERLIYAEGVFRNMLFTLRGFGWLVKFLRYPLSELFSFIDEKTIKIFGESNLYFVCRKI